MIEKALLFGRRKSLVGIVSEPDASASPSPPAVAILNAGVLHRVGPNRLHVQIARALASIGLTTLRFDLSGIGDSRAQGGSDSHSSVVDEDIRDAFDFLESSRGCRNVILVGICSGADNALRAASADERVAGAVLVDGYNLPSLGYVLQMYRERLRSPRSWGRLLLGQSELWVGIQHFLLGSPGREKTAEARVRLALPSSEEYIAQVRSLADRGTDLLLVYTGESPALANYRRLLQRRVRAWASRDRVRVELFEDSDHVFTLRSNQRRLVGLLVEWAQRWSAHGPSAALASAASVLPTAPSY